MALALVFIYRSMDVVNFAQGEMAMISAFIAWQCMALGSPFWLAFALTLVVSFVGAVAIERFVIRPIERAPQLTIVIVTLGLLIALNGLAGAMWGYELKPFPSPFPGTVVSIGGATFGNADLGVIAVLLVTLGAIYLFARTQLGLAMRAAALYPDACRALGIPVSSMLALGWGLAAVVGAISGMLVAPIVFLDPNMMQGIVVYAFAAAVLGGIESPLGAVVGGLILGVALNLLGAYVPSVGNDLRLPAAFAIIVAILVVRPSGLFGRRSVARV
ncbi:MAG: branched-chain amino acid ABC transporter permease [Vulcanimicrobiaceae bacterium]